MTSGRPDSLAANAASKRSLTGSRGESVAGCVPETVCGSSREGQRVADGLAEDPSAGVGPQPRSGAIEQDGRIGLTQSP